LGASRLAAEARGRAVCAVAVAALSARWLLRESTPSVVGRFLRHALAIPHPSEPRGRRVGATASE